MFEIYGILEIETGMYVYVGCTTAGIDNRFKAHTTVGGRLKNLFTRDQIKPVLLESVFDAPAACENKWISDLTNAGHPLINTNLSGYDDFSKSWVYDGTSPLYKERRLSTNEFKSLRHLLNQIGSIEETANYIGIERNVLCNINVNASGLPTDIAKVRKALLKNRNKISEAINQPA